MFILSFCFRKHLKVSCTVLEKLLIAVSPDKILQQFEGELLAGFRHTSEIVQNLCLHQVNILLCSVSLFSTSVRFYQNQ